MSRVTKVQEAAEAVCAALFKTDWEPMGDSPDGSSTWFIRGIKPRQVRVEVQRSHLVNYLTLKIEWFNLSTVPLHGQELFQIPCSGKSVTDDSIMAATTAGVLRCLEIFRDVLAGEGVAGRAVADANKKALDTFEAE